MTKGKCRADQLLVDRGLVDSRSRAQALILAGKVFQGDRRVNKAGDMVAADAALELRGQDHPWVSRGGLKLDHALRHFCLSPDGLICLDVGASTGGFTDVLLKRGAREVAPSWRCSATLSTLTTSPSISWIASLRCSPQ